MTEHVLARALEPFFTTKPREHGTGLGLAVAHGIVIDHGGSISIDSDPGRGTSVTVALPLCSPPPQRRPGDSEQASLIREGARVLVVEDNVQVRSVVSGALAAAGLRVIEAGDGLEALELFEQSQVDLAVIDVDLPRIGWVQCLARIRRLAPGLPAILVSGLPEDAAAKAAGEGVVFLQKPFHLGELKRIASELLACAPVG